MQRSVPVRGLPALVAELGCDPAAIFAGTGLAREDLERHPLIPLQAFVRLLENAASLTGRVDIAIQLGLRQTPDSLGPVGELMSLAPTLGDALADLVALQMDNSSGAAVYLHRLGDDFALGIGAYAPDVKVSSLAYDLAAVTGYSIIAHLSGGKVKPQEILLIRPPPVDMTPFLQFGSCRVRFDQPQCCLILPAHSLAHRLDTANADRHESMLHALQARLAQSASGTQGRVRHALRPLLLQGRDSLGDVAAAMGRHPRQLERDLEREGAVFETLKDSVRAVIAKELLRLTSLAVGDIASSVNYASHSSFVRAFRRWTATTPSAWRASGTRHERTAGETGDRPGVDPATAL